MRGCDINSKYKLLGHPHPLPVADQLHPPHSFRLLHLLAQAKQETVLLTHRSNTLALRLTAQDTEQK